MVPSTGDDTDSFPPDTPPIPASGSPFLYLPLQHAEPDHHVPYSSQPVFHVELVDHAPLPQLWRQSRGSFGVRVARERPIEPEMVVDARFRVDKDFGAERRRQLDR